MRHTPAEPKTRAIELSDEVQKALAQSDLRSLRWHLREFESMGVPVPPSVYTAMLYRFASSMRTFEAQAGHRRAVQEGVRPNREAMGAMVLAAARATSSLQLGMLARDAAPVVSETGQSRFTAGAVLAALGI